MRRTLSRALDHEPGKVGEVVKADPIATDWADQMRDLIVTSDRGRLYAAERILKKFTKPESRPKDMTLDVKKAEKIILKFVQHLLMEDKFEEAATILWGRSTFDWRPSSTRLIWRNIRRSSKLLAMGAGAMSKSYSAAVYFLLDWLKDPEHTCVKVLSVTQEHALRNVFAHIKNLHRSACIKLPGEAKAQSIQANEDNKQGIHLVTIPQGDEGKGRLRGFHPVSRGGRHKVFGDLTRIRVILDEAEEIPGGVWEDVDNILITISEEYKEHIKVFAATNPKDRMSRFGIRCEPEGGWSKVNMEDDVSWKSRLGWDVIRLDGARCENVVHKRIVFPGLLTYEGFQSYVLHGDTTPEYYTMARGWFPEQGLSSNVIPHDIAEKSVGILRFVGPATPCVAFDLALEGDDEVIASLGKRGMCDGWMGPDSVWHTFADHRLGIQCEQQISFPKKRTLELAQSIRDFCKRLHIAPADCIMDRTGNGSGVHDSLMSIWSPDVQGVNFSWAATDMRVMGDDSAIASDEYDGIVTELVFALRKFMEFDVIKLSPTFRHDQLIRECISRRYRQSGKKLRVEPKAEYMKRTQSRSPDRMDSITLLVHRVRTSSTETVVMVPDRDRVTPRGDDDAWMGERHVDTIDFIDMSQE